MISKENILIAAFPMVQPPELPYENDLSSHVHAMGTTHEIVKLLKALRPMGIDLDRQTAGVFDKNVIRVTNRRSKMTGGRLFLIQ